MIPGDILSAFPHRQFHTLPGLLVSWAALPNSYPNACMPMQGGSLITLRVLALCILKLSKFSAQGCRLNLRRAALHDLIAAIQLSLNHGLLCFLLEYVLRILSSAIEIQLFEKYVILSSSVLFASGFNFKIHEFLNSSHFALLRFHRRILSSSSGPEFSKMIEKWSLPQVSSWISNCNPEILMHLQKLSLLPSKFPSLGVNKYMIYYHIKVDYFY